MIKLFITQREQFELRRRNITNHIRLLEARYSEPERQEAVMLLKALLVKISGEYDGFQV